MTGGGSRCKWRNVRLDQSQIELAVSGLALAVLVGVVESIMARLRLLVVPQLLVGAAALAVVAFILILH